MNLSKGSSINLSKDTDNLNNIKVILEWNTPKDSQHGTFDLDATAYGLINSDSTTSGYELFEEEYFIYHRNLSTPNGSIIHSGDDKDGSEGEEIKVDLRKIPEKIMNIPFFVTIHRAQKKGQHFGQVKDSSIRIINEYDDSVIAQYKLENNFNECTAIQFGTLYKTSEGWEFKAIGEGYQYDLKDILYSFGLEV